jgi:hypothetical protein
VAGAEDAVISLLSPDREAATLAVLEQPWHDHGEAHVHMAKFAEAPQTQWLSGRLVLTQTGWVLLEVPNALMRGCMAAINEPGIELPPKANAHISVMNKDDVESIEGDISERGKEFKYTLGPVRSVKPKGWKDVSECWFVEVRSPELSALRRSYGLPSLPSGNHKFHITFAVRKKKVLTAAPVTKAAAKKKREQPAGFVTESEKIKVNQQGKGAKSHTFEAAEWTHPNGHPRCIWCGDEERCTNDDLEDIAPCEGHEKSGADKHAPVVAADPGAAVLLQWLEATNV